MTISPDPADSSAPLTRRLAELAALTPGWHDGDGLAPTLLALTAAREFAAGAPALAAGLKAYPTLDGGISIERQTERGAWGIEFNPAATATITLARFAGPGAVVEPADHAAAAANLAAFLAEPA